MWGYAVKGEGRREKGIVTPDNDPGSRRATRSRDAFNR
jgi:hypothetical protein